MGHLEPRPAGRAPGRSRAGARRRRRGSRRRSPSRAGRAPARRPAQSANGQQRVARATVAVGLDRALVRDGQRARLRPAPPARVARCERVEDRPVRLLRRVGEVAVEAVQEDRGPALDERERLAPEPQREAERRGRRRAAGSAARAAGAASSAGSRSRSRRGARRASPNAPRLRAAAPRRAPRTGGPAYAAVALSVAAHRVDHPVARARPAAARTALRNGERAMRSSASGSYG